MKTIKPSAQFPLKKLHAYLNGLPVPGLALLLYSLALPGQAQITVTDGNWAAKQTALTNTPQAAFMARVGDIDNLGFGWPTSFDPFSGNSTGVHGFPWTLDPTNPDGTDRIMVVSSYSNSPPCGQDGYTGYTSRPDNSVRPIVLSVRSAPAITVTNAVLQIFVDDFQATVWCANYQVTLNNRRTASLESVINALNQTGPVGKLITVIVPAGLLSEIATGRLEFRFDDPTTGAGDGYAIDFIKLLVNVGSLPTGTIPGYVRDEQTQQPISGAKVTSFNTTTTADQSGFYTLTNVPGGLALVEASADRYSPSSKIADVIAGQTTTGVNFALKRAPLTLAIAPAVELRFFGSTGKSYVLQYSSDFINSYDDETILGSGVEVVRFRLATGPHRFWRVKQN